MVITVQLPDDLAQHSDPGREALEALAIEGYRSGALSAPQSSQLLSMGRIEFQDFLAAHGVTERHYGADELRQDFETMRRLEAEGLIPK